MSEQTPGPVHGATDPEAGRGPRIVVVPQHGAGTPPPRAARGTDEPDDDAAEADDEDPSTMVGQPAKVMRIGTMIKQLLEEVRSAPLDDAARTRLATVHERSLHELEDGLSPELVAELHRITLPFTDDQTPSDAELRIAQAQLVGWLEGLFHGLQTALVAQQMAAQAQLSQMRRALPPGSGEPMIPGRLDAGPAEPTTGQYL